MKANSNRKAGLKIRRCRCQSVRPKSYTPIEGDNVFLSNSIGGKIVKVISDTEGKCELGVHYKVSSAPIYSICLFNESTEEREIVSRILGGRTLSIKNHNGAVLQLREVNGNLHCRLFSDEFETCINKSSK